eukprot:scaffold3385_cov241-Pinguiococcus_pyrenoidosus.AAC.4
MCAHDAAVRRFPTKNARVRAVAVARDVHALILRAEPQEDLLKGRIAESPFLHTASRIRLKPLKQPGKEERIPFRQAERQVSSLLAADFVGVDELDRRCQARDLLASLAGVAAAQDHADLVPRAVTLLQEERVAQGANLAGVENADLIPQGIRLFHRVRREQHDPILLQVGDGIPNAPLAEGIKTCQNKTERGRERETRKKEKGKRKAMNATSQNQGDNQSGPYLWWAHPRRGFCCLPRRSWPETADASFPRRSSGLGDSRPSRGRPSPGGPGSPFQRTA